MDAIGMPFAQAELGTAEFAGARNHNPRILEYLQTVGNFATDETPWCSAFVNWVMEQAGVGGTHRANARSWLHWGFPMAQPAYGCVVVFSRGTSSWQGPVGSFIRRIGDDIEVLGGNQRNAVGINRYPVSRRLGYRWPNPVGEVETRDQSGRVISRELIEGMVITGS